MVEYSEIEIALIDKFVDTIDDFIEREILSIREKDKMMLTSYFNEEHKKKFIKKEIKKTQKKLAKCDSDIASFLGCFINNREDHNNNMEQENLRRSIVKDFFLEEFIDVVDLLKGKFNTIKSITDIHESTWEIIIEEGQYGVDDGLVNHFIELMALSDRLKSFKCLLEFKMVENEAEETNEIYDLLDTIRTKDHTDLQLYDIVKERTQLNKDALQYFYKDIEVYLFSEKDDFEGNFSEDESVQAIKDLKDKGHTEDDLIQLGYIKKSKVYNIETNKMDLDFTYINKEKLFFPFEFLPIYQLQGLINAELSKIQEKEEVVKPEVNSALILKTDISVPQLALLFKMVNDLKPKIFNTESDAELFRFISTNYKTKKSTERGISTQKLRNEFSNPDLKAIEFWEKHLHTMLDNLRKLK